MGVATKAGDWAFKAFTAGLGLATIYLTATFSVNVYRGLAWHNAQTFGLLDVLNSLMADLYLRMHLIVSYKRVKRILNIQKIEKEDSDDRKP